MKEGGPLNKRSALLSQNQSHIHLAKSIIHENGEP